MPGKSPISDEPVPFVTRAPHRHVYSVRWGNDVAFGPATRQWWASVLHAQALDAHGPPWTPVDRCGRVGAAGV